MKDRQPEKAERQLAALAMSTAAIAAPANSEAFGQGGAVASATIPTALGVVIAFATVTPKTTGIFFAQAGVITQPNQNGGAQSFQVQFAVTSTPPTIGVTTLVGTTGQPPTTNLSGQSASASIGSIVVAATGATRYICLVAAQSVAGSFALASGIPCWIATQELGA